MARFNLPSARPAVPANATSTATDFYALLASAVTAANPTNQSRDLSNSGTLIPPTVHGEDRLSFIAAQRERLSILLSALDKEANTLSNPAPKPSPRHVPSMFFDGAEEDKEADRPVSGLSSRKSEADFEKIEAESGTEDLGKKRQVSGGSWLPWSWGVQSVEKEAQIDTVMGEAKGVDSGKSSGIDA